MNAPTTQRNDVKHSSKQILTFFALTFAWSWTCWLLAPVVKADSSFVASTLFFMGGFGPSLAALCVVASTSGRAGLRTSLARCLKWQGRRGWITLAFLAPLAVLTAAASVHMSVGGALPPSPAAGHVTLLLTNLGLVFLVGGPLAEELGWRGYALPLLQDRMGWRTASLLLDGIWALGIYPCFLSQVLHKTKAQSLHFSF